MRSVGDLCTLVRSESRVQWENVLRPNVSHVLKSLVSGVKYLHDMGIQHYDLKCMCAYTHYMYFFIQLILKPGPPHTFLVVGIK